MSKTSHGYTLHYQTEAALANLLQKILTRLDDLEARAAALEATSAQHKVDSVP